MKYAFTTLTLVQTPARWTGQIRVAVYETETKKVVETFANKDLAIDFIIFLVKVDADKAKEKAILEFVFG